MKKAFAPLPKCRESYNEMDAPRQKKVDDINCHGKPQKRCGTGTFGPLWIGLLIPAEFGKSSSDQFQGIGLREQWIGSARLALADSFGLIDHFPGHHRPQDLRFA